MTVNRDAAIETVGKHFRKRFTDGRYGADFHETLVDALVELGVVAPDKPAGSPAGQV